MMDGITRQVDARGQDRQVMAVRKLISWLKYKFSLSLTLPPHTHTHTHTQRWSIPFDHRHVYLSLYTDSSTTAPTATATWQLTAVSLVSLTGVNTSLRSIACLLINLTAAVCSREYEKTDELSPYIAHSRKCHIHTHTRTRTHTRTTASTVPGTINRALIPTCTASVRNIS